MITPREQPAPGGFESSEISSINDQIAVDLFKGRNFGIDREVGQAKSLCHIRHRIAVRCLLQSYDDGMPFSQELRQWMITIRAFPAPSRGKLPKFAAFHFEHEHSAGRAENQKVPFSIRVVIKAP